jgi:hypothetical protein
MTGQRERLDETIDRVAAELTMVPADLKLAERICQQLKCDDARHPFAWRRAVAGVCVVSAALLLTFVLTDRRPTNVDSRSHAVTSPILSATRVQFVPFSNSVRDRRVARHPAESETEGYETQSRVPSLAPPAMPKFDVLTSPALAVDTLISNPLTIAPVTVVPLDVATLTVGDVGERESPKE